MTHVHFLGIGGSGISAIANIAQAQGFKITGCDRKPYNEFTTSFQQDKLFTNHSKKHLTNIDILAVTPAVFSLDPDNEEILEARHRGIPVLTWQQFMGTFLEKDKFIIAISGTHGKSTTTAMIGCLLEDAGLDPTVELGAIVPKWNKNYRIGESKYFVTEADEFNNNFYATKPNISIITNIDMDHPEFFKTFDDYKDSFENFLSQTKDLIIANLNNPEVGDVMKYVIKRTHAATIDYTKSEFNLNLKLYGKHNLENATAAFQVGLFLGIDPTTISKSLNGFDGLSRRFEFIGKYKQSDIYTDFAHHPTEINVTLNTIKENFPSKQIIIVYQPHMYSRTKSLFDEFVNTFRKVDADKIYILDIFPSREKDTGIVHSKDLVNSINKHNVVYMKNKDQLFNELKETSNERNIIFFIGAGDIDQYAKEFVQTK